MARGSEDEAGDLDGWWRVGVVVVRPLARLLFRMRFLGVENIPLEGPAIIASSHVSVLDGPALAIPPAALRRRRIRFLVAAENFRILGIGWVLRTFRQIPIRRGTGDAHALDTAIDTIRSGALAGIFPEGHVNPDPTHLARVRRGAARISLATGAPVVPAGIWGSQARWPRGGPRYRPGGRPALTIAFGEPIDPQGQGDPDSQDDVKAFTDRLTRAIQEASATARRDAQRR